MNQIVITPACKECCLSRYRIREERIIECIEKPTNRHILTVDDLQVEFYTLREKSGRYSLLVVGQRIESELRVLYAYKILDSLIPHVQSLTPLEMLEAFIDRFGLLVNVGGKQAKFFLDEKMDIEEGADMATIVSLAEPPPEGGVTMVSFFKQSKDKKQLDCALSYCLDNTKYLSWINS